MCDRCVGGFVEVTIPGPRGDLWTLGFCTCGDGRVARARFLMRVEVCKARRQRRRHP